MANSSLSQHVQDRSQMVERQIAGRGITDQNILDAMTFVPRHRFVPASMAEFAYDDTALPIEEGQTISQPYVVAEMLHLAEVQPGDRVLDVGTGSGYGAALLSCMADEVYSIERYPGLAERAVERLAELGFDNVHVRQGDGTRGWPEHAPYDAIIVAAGGPDVPPALLEQLALGGRLVMPVGSSQREQSLLRIRRRGRDDFQCEDLGSVAFVPLVGEAGWQDVDDRRALTRGGMANGIRGLARRVIEGRPRGLAERIRQASIPLPELAGGEFGLHFDHLAEARVVLLGEATHGTSEFYRARSQITQRLIERHGFSIVAVEADWPDAAQVDRYVRDRHLPQPREKPFQRFPTWMWRNAEMREFIDWLHDHNRSLDDGRARTGFYGLDLYSLWSSIGAVLDYLDAVDPEAAAVARERYGCLSPWQRDPVAYGRAALSSGFAPCADKVVAMLRDILKKRIEYERQDGEAFLDAAQNARLVAAAERYYRAMYYGSHSSWNLRDRHMFETLQSILEARGPDAKAVVWAHNSHIGNAAATEMGRLRDEINLGQLCREHYGNQARLVGFGTDHGTVTAASNWDEPPQIMTVQPARDDSYERLWRDARRPHSLLDLRELEPDLRAELMPERLERAIGVIYRPESELLSHYFDASLADQFDDYVWFEATTAVEPLTAESVAGVPDTYPFGL